MDEIEIQLEIWTKWYTLYIDIDTYRKSLFIYSYGLGKERNMKWLRKSNRMYLHRPPPIARRSARGGTDAAGELRKVI